VIRGVLLAFQVLLWLLVLRFVMRMVASAFGRPRTAVPGARERPQVGAPEDLVLDRVCHTYVPRSHAISARVSGREEWYCSAACRDQARAAAPTHRPD
jgi:uncharacterized protein